MHFPITSASIIIACGAFFVSVEGNLASQECLPTPADEVTLLQAAASSKSHESICDEEEDKILCPESHTPSCIEQEARLDLSAAPDVETLDALPAPVVPALVESPEGAPKLDLERLLNEGLTLITLLLGLGALAKVAARRPKGVARSSLSSATAAGCATNQAHGQPRWAAQHKKGSRSPAKPQQNSAADAVDWTALCSGLLDKRDDGESEEEEAVECPDLRESADRREIANWREARRESARSALRSRPLQA